MEYKLGEIADFSQGKQVDLKKQYSDNKGNMKRFIRIVDYTNTNEPIRFVDDYGKKYYVNKDDLVMIRYGSQTAGKVVMGKSGIIANNMFKINLNNKIVSNKYMYYYLSQKNILDYLRGSQSSSTMPAINFTILNNFVVNLPKLSIQNKIVQILDNLDKKIKLNYQINDNLHAIDENYFLEISKNGKEVKLEELIYDIQSGSREKGGAVTMGVPSIGAEKIEKLGIYNFLSEKYISEQHYQKMKNGIVKSGDVLLYKDGAYAGKVSMAFNNFPHKKCAINEHVFILRTKNNWANCYLYFLLYYSKTREQLQAMASSKAAQPGLNQNEVKDVKVMLPTKEKIKEFEKNVKVIVEKIIENSIENKTLEQLRDTLLPKLMNGEIDLENIEI